MGLLVTSIPKKSFKMASATIALSMLLSTFNMAPVTEAAKAAGEASHLLSYEGAAYASSMEGDGLSPEKAVDGRRDTRWGSAFSADPQWIYIDLGAPASIDKVVLDWENAYSKSYKIQVSDDESDWKDIYVDTEGNGGIDTIQLTGSGRYIRMLSLQRSGGYGVSLHEFEVYGTGGSNPLPIVLGKDVAQNQPVVASSYQPEDGDKPALPPAFAVDGDKATRWSSKHTSDEWIYVDLGSVHTIGRVRLDWENAAGRIYDIQVSNDAANWTTVYREMDGHDGVMDTELYATGRYVRMKGISRTTSYGYSLFGFSVYDYVEGDPKPAYTIPALPTASVVNVGAGSYLTNDLDMPQPRSPMNKTEDVKAPIASNDWWQSVLIKNLSDSLVTLPLKSKYTAKGLGILTPGAGWVNESGNSQAADGAPDFYLNAGNISASRLGNKVSGYSDWTATVVLSDNATKKMETTFVKGSPYLYSEFADPTTPELYFPAATAFFDDNNNPILAADGATLNTDHIGFTVSTVDGSPKQNKTTRHYGVFAPEGSVFMKVGNKIKIRLGGGQNYLSLAAIPAANQLNYFYKHGYAFVESTTVTPEFNEETSEVTTKFDVSIDQKRADMAATTLMTLLPHQWKLTPSPLTDLSYPSIRGTLKLLEGNSFTTVNRFQGIVPQFTNPDDPTYSKEDLIEMLGYLDESTAKNYMNADAYWQGKALHPLGMGVLVADQIGDTYYKNIFLGRLKTILTDWFTYTKGEPNYFFYYDPTWGTMYYKNSEFGANTGLTDHHFTYGYIVFAAAVLATYDQEFKDNYGEMVEHLIRDFGNPDKDDPMYPFLRNFDPYEGHSWAGGYGDNNNGNNQEAAGESLFGWVGEYLWGMLSGNADYRDIAIYGFTTELTAVEQYWFNYDNDNWLPEFNHKATGQVYGSAYNFGTFFSGDPVNIYGIHWLPTGEYLTSYGFDAQKAADLYNGMVEDNNGPENAWYHIVWPIEALSNPQAVLDKFTVENTQKNEIFNTYWFVHNMATLGTRTKDIWASGWSSATVYKKGNAYSAMIWNPTNVPVEVTFRSEAGVTGSATVGPKALVKVDPTKVTDLNVNKPPQLNADTTKNSLGQSIDLTFADNLGWREAISGLKVNGVAAEASKFIVKPGKITLDASLFEIEDGYDITIQAAGYPDTAVEQVIITNSTVNLALNKPTSTSDKPNNPGSFAVDGKLDTRWESAFSDPQYIAVNLKSEYKISRVVLNWENAAGKNYSVQVSSDGQTWDTVYETTRGHEGIDDITFPAVNARYVKVVGTERTTNYGYSLWELEVYGTSAGALDTPELTPDKSMNMLGQPIDITFTDEMAWAGAVNGVKVNGTALEKSQFAVMPGKLTIDASAFPEVGIYDISIEAAGFKTAVVQQLIITNSNVNLALNKTTFTSDKPLQPGNNAIDGKKDTRWESAFSDPQFIAIDLGADYTISRVLLNWENAAGQSYSVQVSSDRASWKTVYATTTGKPGINDISFIPEKARYVRMEGTKRTTGYGYSLFEFEVYGNESDAPTLLVAPTLTADTTKNEVGQPIEITFDDDEAWRASISSLKANGTPIGNEQYQVAPGKITLKAGLFGQAQTYEVSVQAAGYLEANVQQIITEKADQPQQPDNPGEHNPSGNLALHKPTASSPDFHKSSADAVDGRFDRRWESAFSDTQWMSVDLGAPETINRVFLAWEDAYGKAYTIDVSLDGETWTTVYSTSNGNGGTDDISFKPVKARFVKMNGLKRGTPYGFSLWEFEVYAGDTSPLTGPVLVADTKNNSIGEPVEISFADDAAWRSKISSVELNGIALSPNQYSLEEGKLTLSADLFIRAQTNYIHITASGYENAVATQPIENGNAVNLALQRPTTTSDPARQSADRAVDGDKNTRWESPFADPQWIMVDLGSTHSIRRVLLNWENAAAKAYTIEVSVDGKSWTTIYSTNNGREGINNVFVKPIDARYVKINGTERTTNYGYSLFDLEVYE
ncbi:discoidin domain-containing protein [Paenibacillus glycanilyticus]|uniref:discoidin domain-containing protein n=1 Tax=Paenibacillus glycanilyticus TaxID=126569 RepID=UPI00203B12B7|nr:discoidin domain-containing protein [Paenibacillus glycanilyticus]MCM3630177.1 discoidin domain-containing protein [Paenibacillus glycanilyticus]